MTIDPALGTEVVRARGLLKLALEGRTPFELAAALAALPLFAATPRGDDHPVLVLPGLAAFDLGTRPLRRLLRGLGHDARGWGLGRNLDPSAGVLEAARVLTGSPRSTIAWRLFEWLNGRERRPSPRVARLRRPTPKPTTSIFSRRPGDPPGGIVARQCSVERPKPAAGNVVVPAIHTGLGVNPLALHALADRLAQPGGAWRPFERREPRRWLYADSGRFASEAAR